MRAFKANDCGELQEASPAEVILAAGLLWDRTTLCSFSMPDNASVQKFAYWSCAPIDAPCHLIVLNHAELGVEQYLLAPADVTDIGSLVSQMPRFKCDRSIWIVGAHPTAPPASDPIAQRYMSQLHGRDYKYLRSVAVDANKTPRLMSIPRCKPPGLWVEEDQKPRALRTEELYKMARSLMARRLQCGQTLEPFSESAANVIRLRSSAKTPPHISLMFTDAESRLVHYQPVCAGKLLSIASLLEALVHQCTPYKHGNTTLIYSQQTLLTRLSDAERKVLTDTARRLAAARVPLSSAAIVGMDGVEFYTTQGLRIHKPFLSPYLSTQVS